MDDWRVSREGGDWISYAGDYARQSSSSQLAYALVNTVPPLDQGFDAAASVTVTEIPFSLHLRSAGLTLLVDRPQGQSWYREVMCGILFNSLAQTSSLFVDFLDSEGAFERLAEYRLQDYVLQQPAGLRFRGENRNGTWTATCDVTVGG